MKHVEAVTLLAWGSADSESDLKSFSLRKIGERKSWTALASRREVKSVQNVKIIVERAVEREVVVAVDPPAEICDWLSSQDVREMCRAKMIVVVLAVAEENGLEAETDGEMFGAVRRVSSAAGCDAVIAPLIQLTGSAVAQDLWETCRKAPEIVVASESFYARRLDPSSDDDCKNMMSLLTSDGWSQNIGDMNIRSVGDARDYIERRPLVMYKENGFGSLAIIVRDLERGEQFVGCGGIILRPEFSPDVDLGFALLPAYYSKGYAFAMSQAMISWLVHTQGINRILAVTWVENGPAKRLLNRLGFLERCDHPEMWGRPQSIFEMML